MDATLLEEFLRDECTPYVRNLLRTGIESARSASGPRRRRFEFNRYEITFDLDTGDVLIENVLDATEAGAQRIPIAEFSAALDAAQTA